MEGKLLEIKKMLSFPRRIRRTRRTCWTQILRRIAIPIILRILREIIFLILQHD